MIKKIDKNQLKHWSFSKLKSELKKYHKAFKTGQKALRYYRSQQVLQPLIDSISAINNELQRRGVGMAVRDNVGTIVVKDFKKRIKLWSVSKLKMKFKHYYNAVDLSSNRERVLLRNSWLLDSMKAIKSELKKRGTRITAKEVLGSAIDDVGANVGVAIGAFIIAGAVGFGLYKLVLEPALAEKLPEENGEPNGDIPVTPMSFKPSLGRRYQIANVNEFANIRKGPRLGAGLLSDLPTIGKLGKVYVCLNRQQDSAGYWWCQIISPRILLWLGGWIRTDKLKAV